MKIAIIGTGIAGNTAAYLLRGRHDITVFEAEARTGGHSHTVEVDTDAGPLAVDTGFIVFNDRTYPAFNRLLVELAQDWQPSVMSFSVQCEAEALEYCGSSLDGLFADRRNLLRPSFWRMVRDILRFNRLAATAAERGDGDWPLGAWLERHRFCRAFTEHYVVPMAAAIWSAEPRRVRDMPVGFLATFFANHGLLQLSDRPNWRVIPGGSRAYVDKLTAGHRDRIRLGCAVTRITRHGDHVRIKPAATPVERYDAVFVACHSDQALALLGDATASERAVLGAFDWQENVAVLHTDASLLPRRRRAWAAWNYHVPRDPGQPVAVTYHMNMLQSLPCETRLLVTLNNPGAVAPRHWLRCMTWQHPVFDSAAVVAQSRHAEINSGTRTFYCGAYWRNGFHEDGVQSAEQAVRHFEEEMRHGKLHFRRAG